MGKKMFKTGFLVNFWLFFDMLKMNDFDNIFRGSPLLVNIKLGIWGFGGKKLQRSDN